MAENKTYKDLEDLLMSSKNKETTAEQQTAGLNAASQAAYQQNQIANQQAQNQYAQNTAANQASALDAIRKSNASAIANGANAGLSAANQLSAILGLQETTSEEATKLANADINAAAQLNEQLNKNAVAGQKAANEYNLGLGANQAEIGKAITQVYAADQGLEASKVQAQAQKDAVQIQTDAETKQTEEANKINDKSVEYAQNEANYNKAITALDNVTTGWKTGDGQTYATKYWDPWKNQVVEGGNADNQSGGTARDIQQVAAKIKSELAAAYASKDPERIKTWINHANKFATTLETEDDACLIPGTLITMADGSFKKVEDIKAGDMVQVWDLEHGKFMNSPILFNDIDIESKYNVVQLEFSDKTKVGFIYEHGFFDLTLKKYVYLHSAEEARKFIGHRFIKSDGIELHSVTLDIVLDYIDTIKTYSPVSSKHLCIFANGMLTMPGATEVFTNFININEDTMSFDKQDLKDKLEEFGECPYTLFENYISQETFEAFQGKYINIIIGLGHANMLDIGKLIGRYQEFLK